MPYNSLTEESALCADDDASDLNLRRRPWWRKSVPRRYVVALLAFLGFCNVYAMRVNLSVAIVAMTSNNTSGESVTKPDFVWDSQLQGIILSSFFYGYIVTQIPGGWLAPRIGGKKLFGFGVFGTAALTLLTPLAAKISVYLLIACRMLEGLFEGVTYPCMHAILSQWAPPFERSRLATLAFSGSYLGTVVALPISGLLAERVGWPSIFYLFGTCGILWCILWWFVVYERPQDDCHISDSELHYIRVTVGPPEEEFVRRNTPWKCFFTTSAVWAIIIAHFCENWGFYTLLTELPTFMRDLFGFDLRDAGFLAAVPYLVMSFTVQIGGHIADWLLSNEYMSITKVRKVFNCSAFVVQTFFMTLATYMASPSAAIACISLAVGFGGFAWSGFSVNHLDIAPQYASVLMGISNTVATIPGIVSPTVTGLIVQHRSSAEWKVVFYIAASVYLGGAAFYALFASGERQRWAETCIDGATLESDGDSASDDATAQSREE